MNRIISKEDIILAVRAAVEPLEGVYAMWEGGAAAFGRADQWSDIDLQVDAADDATEDVFQQVEAALERLSPIAVRYRLPEPTWHGHSQAFYRLQNASPYLLIDFVVLKHTNPNKFLESQIHGKAVFHFDKIGLEAAAQGVGGGAGEKPLVNTFDEQAWAKRLCERREQMLQTFDMFQIFISKELKRSNWIEALAFYQGFTLRPLVEALRMRYAPAHYNFHTRYVYYDLPREVVQRLEKLFFPAAGPALGEMQAEAQDWFHETMRLLDQ